MQEIIEDPDRLELIVKDIIKIIVILKIQLQIKQWLLLTQEEQHIQCIKSF